MFAAQVIAVSWSSIVQLAVFNWALGNIPVSLLYLLRVYKDNPSGLLANVCFNQW
jgi:hypothetical protein